jgi:transcriptional regulator with XRE-family HTH domain
MRRDGLAIPQEDLAASLNISPAKLQQYEVDGKRVEASRLFEIARLLKVPVFYFFSEIDDREAETMSNKITANAEQLTSILRS